MGHKSKTKRRRYLKANKSRLDIAAKKWRQDNKEHLRQYMQRPERKAYRRNYDRLRRLGITPEQFDAKLVEQGNVCGLCGLPFNAEAPRADHDHVTGEFRGVLHRHCNLGLGTFNDDSILLDKAARYLRQFIGQEKTSCQSIESPKRILPTSIVS
jgi:hypothetical protein